MKFCPECGKPVSDSNKFCSECGHPLVQPSGGQEQPKENEPQNYTICPQCGTHNPAGIMYCQKCGYTYKITDKVDYSVEKDNTQARQQGGSAPQAWNEPVESPFRTPVYQRKKKSHILRNILIVLVVIALIPSILRGFLGSNEGNSSEESEVLQKQESNNEDVTVQEEAAEEEPEEEPEEAPEALEVAIPEIAENTVIYEGNDVVISVMGIEQVWNGWDVKLLIENDSSLNLGFNAHAYAVNGIMTGNNIYDMDCDVAAGKKANTILTIKNSVLEEYGITEIRCIDALFWAYDNDKSYKEFDTGQIEIQTSLYEETHDRFENVTLYNADGIRVDYMAKNPEAEEYAFAFTNTTGSHLDFDIDELTINDYTSSDLDFDLIDVAVLNDCQAIVIISLENEFLELNNITDIETIEFNISIRPLESYSEEYKIGPIGVSLDTEGIS